MSCEPKGPKTPEPADSGHGERNRYFAGKLMTAADYRLEQLYAIQRRRMIARSVLGWGVVTGFKVEAENGRLSVGEGIAFDAHGRELVACSGVCLDSVEDVVWLQGCKVLEAAPPLQGTLLLSAHYAERKIDGVRVKDSCWKSSSEWNHLRETVVYSLRAWPDGKVGPSPCLPPQYGSDAGPRVFLEDAAADAAGAPVAQADQRDAAPAVEPAKRDLGESDADDRGPHPTLVHWSHERLEDPCGGAKLCSAGCVSLDPSAGVPLAVVEIGKGPCEGAFIASKVEAEECRRLVRTNDTLYDLIRGCDLTRIAGIGWRDWHGRQETIRLSIFRGKFVAPPAPPPGAQQGDGVDDSYDDDEELRRRGGQAPGRDPVDTDFWISFTAPVKIASLTPDVMSITLIRRDENEDVGEVFRVPIRRLRLAPHREGDPENTTRAFRPMVSFQFWDGEIKRGAASGFRDNNRVEISIHCDSIIDWAGQAVDGNAIGLRLPSGNGTPGGDFLSRFSVSRWGTYPPEPATDQPAR